MSFYDSHDFSAYDHHYNHGDDRREHLKCRDGAKLIVYKRPNAEESLPPQENDEWRGLKNNWQEPEFMKGAVHFHNGLVEVRSPGIYNYKMVSTIFTLNESETPISGQTFIRLSRGRKCRDNDYEITRNLATDTFAAVVPNISIIEERRRYSMLSLDVNVVIRQCDIDRCDNYLIPEYRLFVHLSPDQQWPEGLTVGLDTADSENYINVTKIGDVC